MHAHELQSHLRSLAAVNEPSVDRIIVGDPATVISRVGTCWMPYWQTCRDAVAQGVNTLVVHEPTFYTHWDLDAKQHDFLDAREPGRGAYLSLRDAKREWIEKQGLVIIRCHDVLDRVDHFGIPFALGEALGFTPDDILRGEQFYNVYNVQPLPAREAARLIARHLAPVGQPGVAFYGDPERTVMSIGVGTGCGCDPIHFAAQAPDLYIAIDDTVRTWIQTAFAADSGHPLVVINHGTSEEFGVRKLSEHLKENFPDLDPVHFPQGCTYRWIEG